MPLPEAKLGSAAQYAKDTLASNYQKGVAGITAVALAMIGAGVYKAPSADSASLKGSQPAAQTDSLHSPQYLQKHCKIAVAVNVGSGHTPEHSDGLTVEGKDTTTTIDGKPDQYARLYKWQVSDRDRFCGIIGVWIGPEYKSLAPTLETANGGEYLDTSVDTFSGSYLTEFIAYAEPKA